MSKNIIFIVLGLLVAAGVGGGAAYYFKQDSAPKVVKHEPIEYKFATVDKIIVMLRNDDGSSLSTHYIAVDLVFRTSKEKEAEIKNHLPFLKSTAVKVLSHLNLTIANKMTIEDYHSLLNKEFATAYIGGGSEKPFSDVMVSKLIVE
ncbi:MULTISPECIES: flagellar basal body-associated protein FliL [unclassified Iodobacter]|uniref:flagellar basal body-associated protein FliL n=1 Tax=unclassified Iodobacter TaxID=235634 RepID=UPI0025FC73D1|nr:MULTISPECIES: flagellar basal body-associated protein FliL [unclassified Iodobacter]MDW5417415.1 flagellar basal body-associated protein FliL [Iodobacter sp. CM08]